MALSFLTAKVLRAEVTEGIDLESGAFLTGDRITIGTGPGDTLVLGSADIVAEHLTFVRAVGAKTWDYFSSDRGATAVDKGNPRTGTVRPGMWFRLGNDTKLEILSVAALEDLASSKDDAQKSEIPLAVALPIMGLMLIGFMLYILSIGNSVPTTEGLRTTPWFNGQAAIEPALDECLATGVSQTTENGVVMVERTAPDALFRAFIEAQAISPDAAPAIRDQLAASIRKSIARAHLLAQEGQYLEASQTLRRLENVLPVGLGKCSILSAARSDLAILELRSGRR